MAQRKGMLFNELLNISYGYVALDTRLKTRDNWKETHCRLIRSTLKGTFLS